MSFGNNRVGVWHTIYHHIYLLVVQREFTTLFPSTKVGWWEKNIHDEKWILFEHILKIKHPKIQWMRTSFSPPTSRKRTSITTTLHHRSSSSPLKMTYLISYIHLYPISIPIFDGNSPCWLIKSCQLHHFS